MTVSKFITCLFAGGALLGSAAFAESTVNIRTKCCGNLEKLPTVGFFAYTLPDTIPVNATSISFADGDEGYIQLCDLPAGQSYLLQIVPNYNKLTEVNKNIKIYQPATTTSPLNQPSILHDCTVPADTTGTITLNTTLYF